MATVMKGLRTPRGDAEGRGLLGRRESDGKGNEGHQKLKAKGRKKASRFFFFCVFLFIVQRTDSVEAHHATMPMELNSV